MIGAIITSISMHNVIEFYHRGYADSLTRLSKLEVGATIILTPNKAERTKFPASFKSSFRGFVTKIDDKKTLVDVGPLWPTELMQLGKKPGPHHNKGCRIHFRDPVWLTTEMVDLILSNTGKRVNHQGFVYLED